VDNLISSIVTEYQTAIERKEIGRENKSYGFIKLIYKAFVDEGQVLAEVDKDRIVQVISNLLNNALKSSKRRIEEDTSEEILPIEVTMKRDALTNEILVQVRDRGAGIDQTMQSKLFTKFFTTSEIGTGLGLYISKNLVDAHGGRIWGANNKDGRGATFTFTLPLTINEMTPHTGA
jgi:two-component system, OmpR family, sensor histidine kinase VicK